MHVHKRAIQRYTEKGLLNPEATKQPGTDGRARMTNLYRLAEVEALAAEMAKPRSAALATTTRQSPEAIAPAAHQGNALLTLQTLLQSMPPAGTPLLITVAHAAEVAGVSKAVIRDAIQSGQLQTVRVKARGHRLRYAALIEFINQL